MTRQQSEGEVHVEAMRLILAEMERREDLPDWTIWQHMLNMLETIFQGIENQRDDDRDELMHTRKDRDHWRQARDTAIEGGELLLKSNQTLQAEIETLRQQLADAQQELSEQSMVANVETQQDAAAWQQQVDSANAEVIYLRARLDEERSVIAGLRQQLRTAAGRVDLTEETNRSLRQQLDAAQAAVTLQRAGIEQLQAFVAKARQAIGRTMNYCDVEFLLVELAKLDAEPTAVAERCPECDGSGMVDSGGFGPDGKAISVPCGGDCRGNPCPSQPAPVAEPAPCPKCVKLRTFVEKIRDASWNTLRATAGSALAELDAGTEPAPVAEPLDAEGGA